HNRANIRTSGGLDDRIHRVADKEVHALALQDLGNCVRRLHATRSIGRQRYLAGRGWLQPRRLLLGSNVDSVDKSGFSAERGRSGWGGGILAGLSVQSMDPCRGLECDGSIIARDVGLAPMDP